MKGDFLDRVGLDIEADMERRAPRCQSCGLQALTNEKMHGGLVYCQGCKSGAVHFRRSLKFQRRHVKSPS